MIENLQDKIYQLKSKQVKGAKVGTSLRQELKGEKCFKTI